MDGDIREGGLDSTMFTTRQSSNQEIVDYIGLFRSQEYILAVSRERLPVTLSQKEIADIAASFAQGLEYMNSADQASLKIKPMLQYYGILKGISNNTHLPCGLESLKHVNQQSRRS